MENFDLLKHLIYNSDEKAPFQPAPDYLLVDNYRAESSLSRACGILKVIHRNLNNKFSHYPPHLPEFNWGQNVCAQLREATKCVEDAEGRLQGMRRAHQHMRDYELARTQRVCELQASNECKAPIINEETLVQSSIVEFFPPKAKPQVRRSREGRVSPKSLKKGKMHPFDFQPIFAAEKMKPKSTMINRPIPVPEPITTPCPVTSTKRESPITEIKGKITTICDASPIFSQGPVITSPLDGTYIVPKGREANISVQTADISELVGPDSVFTSNAELEVAEADIAIIAPPLTEPTFTLTPAQQPSVAEARDTVDLAPIVIQHQGFDVEEYVDPLASPEVGIIRVDMSEYGIPGTWYKRGQQVFRETPSPLLRKCGCKKYMKTSWCGHKEQELENFRQTHGIPKWRDEAATSVAKSP